MVAEVKKSWLTPLALGLAWLVSLGGVFALGILSAFSFHLDPSAKSNSEAGLTGPEREAAAVFLQLVGEPLDWPVLRSISPSDRVPPQLHAMLEGLETIAAPDERRVVTRRFFRIVAPFKIEALLEGATESAEPLSAERKAVLRAVMEAWEDRDPAAVADFRAAVRRRPGAGLEWLFEAFPEQR